MRPPSTIRSPVSMAAASNSSPPRGAATALFAVLFVVVAFAPFWYGSNRPLAWHVNAVVLGALLLLLSLGQLASDLVSPQQRGRVVVRLTLPVALFVPFALIGLCGLWMIVQVIPGVPDFLANRYWPLATQALGKSLPNFISIAPVETMGAFARASTDAAMFVCAYWLCGDRQRAAWLVSGLAIVCALYCAFGLGITISGSSRVLFLDKIAYRGDVTATFINRNTFAMFAVIGLVAAGETLFQSWRAFRRGGSFFWVAAAMAMAAIIGAALLLSHSRAGIGIGVLGVLSLGLLWMFRSASGARMIALALGLAAVLVVAALVLAVMFNGDRLARSGDDWTQRVHIYGLVWQAILEAPWTGYGFGTFDLLFPVIRDSELGTGSTWDKAHNVYLEAMVGLGIPASFLLFGGIFWLFALCLIAAVDRPGDPQAPRVAACTWLAVAAHSCLDFSLQIQGISLISFALLGAGVARAVTPRNPASSGSPRMAGQLTRM